MDDKISKYILDKVNFFEDIEPNYITIVGFVTNFFIFTSIVKQDTTLLPIFLFIRWLADTLDGNVARKYDKKSKLGNFLDVFSDSVLFFGILWLLAKMNNIDTKYVYLLFIGIIVMLLITGELLNENKKDINKNTENPITKVCNFLMDNSFLEYIIAYGAIMYSIKKIK
ncbi:CDP-diacylglycerol--glycerol-3-phosphate 3-phosphatidyltransferase [Bodo saltans virus]|jgi:phosphatidylglycerophosphate synthase|uniref:CDP-diacylglycerol--glycerol-3-phosphate 3-phosphatidyltransferase n=1 Tax=Bodo saltans virus TaxID=2024608 RepID=A0A2H4UV19_9VIRU|nr:CDP-diacylglycerol--glycerol-3-phosphate 3-phosphatidyltransferase [Bodo saltans virus]ATZ80772.1 CDP-diacylglycerol--glycerol-3-phosphate 3-phosphatidyltransferase [Bodo saltans virus]